MKSPTMTIRVEPQLRFAFKAQAEAMERTEAGVIRAAAYTIVGATVWGLCVMHKASQWPDRF